MNSDCHNRALESRLVGHWTCSSDLESCEYTFLPHNEFTCVVTRHGESPFKVRGYWDVLGNDLRLGTSPLAAEPAQIVATADDSFTTQRPGAPVTVFKKISQQTS